MLASGVDEGIPWRVIHPKAAIRFPVLIDLICNADNLPTAMARPDSPLEILRKIARDAKANKGNINWEDVLRRVAKTEFNRADDLPDFVEFVKHCC